MNKTMQVPKQCSTLPEALKARVSVVARREDTTMTKLRTQFEVHRVQMGKKRKEHVLCAAEV